MLLVFLLILGLLAFAILGELEGGREAAADPPVPCSGCARPVEADWLVCPRCRRLLQESCPGCGRLRGTHHRFCPWCGDRRKEGR